ncbi:MAG: CoB--CoM heterodisulfide reductase [Candidatus Nephrothrix sp. EaCA]|nr:MAG: CoB--CoM heterodisulfide reductase [Candidatus Nephrothrix sp. EaCA]
MEKPITMAEAPGDIDILFWIGCAGSFDERAKKVTRAVITLLQAAQVNFAVLGEEEKCTGDPARRAGNEFLFQVQAIANIETLNNYRIKKILTACPHCFNSLKNEYSALGGKYEVVHHTVFLQQLAEEGKLKLKKQNHGIVFHDSCYLGRVNNIYEPPRRLLNQVGSLIEMKRNRANGMCCGAGGAQLFKEAEKGNKEISTDRAEEALDTKAATIAVACPFCLTMMTDGVKKKDARTTVKDIAELMAEALAD